MEEKAVLDDRKLLPGVSNLRKYSQIQFSLILLMFNF